MKKRFFALFLAVVLLLSMIPAVYAAPTPTFSVSINADYCYTLTGLPYGLIVQNFFFDDSTLYITQHGGNGVTYLSRLSIQGDKAVYQDHMTLNNCGRGESLAGYYYNNRLYFYIGCKIDTAATTYYSTQIARVPYEAGKTYTYTQLNRLNHLNYVSKDGTRLGTLYRNNVCANSQYTIFRVQTSEGSVTYACYDTKGLNALLDASQSVDLSTDAPKTKLIYSFTQSGSGQIVRPNSSFQGVELLNNNAIYTCGGAGDVTPMIGKLNNSGKYLCEATISNVGTSSINGLQALNGKLYFAVEGNSWTDGQMIYCVDLMNVDTLTSVTDSAGVATLHQLPCVNPDVNKNDYQQNMSYVIRTGGGKTIVIDGGWTDYDSPYLFSYLQKVTGTSTPHIDAWFLTHPHGDHYGALIGFANNYASQVTVDAFYHRMPTATEIDKYFYNANPTKIKNAVANVLNKVGKLRDSHGKATKVVSLNTVHSGKCNSSFNFDDVHFDILMTVEDVFWGCDNITTKYSGTKANAGHVYTNETIAQLTADNLNNSSVVFRVTMGGKTILFLGDSAQSTGIMLKRYHDANQADSSNYFSLKSDIVQIAHHGTNNVQQVVYQAIDADIALWPTPKYDYAATADYSTTQYYTRQWARAIGMVDYASGYGPQVLYFPTDRTNAFVNIPEKLRPYVFDAQYYADRYSDLKTAYGTDEAKLYQHFIEYGIEEGRAASPYFDVAFYMNQNDYNLRYATHGDYTQAFYHFVSNMDLASELTKSPKQLSPLFDTDYYAKAYPELAAQGLDTEFELLEHYALIGSKENRLASDTVLSKDGTFYHQSCNIQQAQEPTCTTSGLTEGKQCKTCGEVIVARETVAALGHAPIYTENSDKTHTITCENCDHAETVACEYEDGKCICGAKEILEPIYDADLKFSHSLTLENDISINFIGQGSALNAYDTFYLECKVPVYNGNELVDYEIVNIEPEYNGVNYVFTLTGVTAKMMNDEIEAIFRLTKDDQKYYSKTDVYSIAEYAYGKLNAENSDSLKAVCADLLRYGALAQMQFNYRTDALVDADMTEENKAYLTDLETVELTNHMQQLSDLDAFTVPWKSATLELGNKVIMCLIANLSNYAGDPTALTMRLTYTDRNGETVTAERPLELYNEEKQFYAVSFDGLRATEMRTIVSAAIYEGETRVSKTVEYSVESYAARNPSDLTRAMLAYGDSANAFFAN